MAKPDADNKVAGETEMRMKMITMMTRVSEGDVDAPEDGGSDDDKENAKADDTEEEEKEHEEKQGQPPQKDEKARNLLVSVFPPLSCFSESHVGQGKVG